MSDGVDAFFAGAYPHDALDVGDPDLAVTDLLRAGGAGDHLDQFVGALAVAVFSFIVTYLIASAIQQTVGLRVEPDQELTGLDQTQHAESAYTP